MNIESELSERFAKPCDLTIGTRTFRRINKNSSKFKIYEIVDGKLKYVALYGKKPYERWYTEFIKDAALSEEDINIFLVTCRITKAPEEPKRFTNNLEYVQFLEGQERTIPIRFLPDMTV